MGFKTRQDPLRTILALQIPKSFADPQGRRVCAPTWSIHRVGRSISWHERESRFWIDAQFFAVAVGGEGNALK
jgi:hypothetical protein